MDTCTIKKKVQTFIIKKNYFLSQEKSQYLYNGHQNKDHFLI